MPATRRARATGTLFAIAGATVVLHALVGQRYGIFRDELYYLACSDHLAWGYVDHPPLSIAVLWAVRKVLGDGLWAIRLPAWLAGGGAVFTAGLLAREVGGGRFAQLLSALCIVIGPIYLAVVHFYSMNALDVLFWVMVAFAFARALSSDRRAWWIVLGVLLGLGLENKISMLWLGAGLGGALVFTAARRWLVTPWPWIAAGIAIALFVPHVVWQIQNGWPTAEFVRNATSRKMVAIAPLEFLLNQIVVQHPLTLPVWIAGLVFLFRGGSGPHELPVVRRALGWLFLVPALILIASGTSRANYLSPAFPIVFAAGAVAVEDALRRRGAWARGTVVAAMVLAGALTAPIGLPILPVDTFVRYAEALKLVPRPEEDVRMGALPQHYADQFGWPELARRVSDVYHALPAAERQRAAIFATNYGRAGAIDYFGKALGLPPAISGHNNYFIWGPRGFTGEVLIIVGGTYDDHAGDFDQLQQVSATSCRYCMPYEDNVAIFVGRKLKAPVRDAWPEVKNYI